MESGTQAQLINGLHNNTHLEVITCASSLLIGLEVIAGIALGHTTHVGSVVVDIGIIKIFTIILIAIETQVGDTEVEPPVNLVREITTQSDVILIGVALLFNAVCGSSVATQSLEVVAIAIGINQIGLISQDTKPGSVAVIVDVSAVVVNRQIGLVPATGIKIICYLVGQGVVGVIATLITTVEVINAIERESPVEVFEDIIVNLH